MPNLLTRIQSYEWINTLGAELWPWGISFEAGTNLVYVAYSSESVLIFEVVQNYAYYKLQLVEWY